MRLDATCMRLTGMSIFARIVRRTGVSLKAAGDALRFVGVRDHPSGPLAETIDLEAPKVLLDPFAHYERLRQGGDVQFLKRHGFWIVLGCDAVQTALTQARSFSNAPYGEVDAVLLGADPPAHMIIRRIVARSFSASRLDHLTAVAEHSAQKLISHRMEVVEGYAAPISRAVAAELIGLDDEVVNRIRAATLAGRHDPNSTSMLVHALDAIASESRLHGQLLDEGNGTLCDSEARSLVRLFWLAATTTTQRVIAQCIYYLVSPTGLARALRGERGLLTPFIEEVTRLHPPEHLLPRVTTDDVHLAGAVIPAGATVHLAVGAANRDPRRWERPAELRLERPRIQHFSFGHGIHQCLGAAIGRRVVSAAIGKLLDQPGDLQPLEPLDRIRYFRSMTTHTPEQLLIGLGI